MAGRQTVPVRFILQRANAYLRCTPDHATEGRKAVAGLLESVLMESVNYEGFRYTISSFNERGVYESQADIRYRPEGMDETRRQYYTNERTR